MSDTGWLRRAGRLDLGRDGDALWSVADGRRGRRWRSLRRDARGGVVSDLLLELDPAGAWLRLEVATRDGILTLHPEPGDGPNRRAHGNVVIPGGLRHLAVPWSEGWWLAVVDEPIAAFALQAAGPAGLLVHRSLEVEIIDGGPPDGLVGVAGDLPGPSWPLEGEPGVSS